MKTKISWGLGLGVRHFSMTMTNLLFPSSEKFSASIFSIVVKEHLALYCQLLWVQSCFTGVHCKSLSDVIGSKILFHLTFKSLTLLLSVFPKVWGNWVKLGFQQIIICKIIWIPVFHKRSELSSLKECKGKRFSLCWIAVTVNFYQIHFCILN